MTITQNSLTFTARDGYPLSGMSITPEAPKAALLISTGTGFPFGYYKRFATASAERGFATLLFDWRGIGASAPDDLAQLNMDYPDWGRFDFPAAIEAAAALAPDKSLLHVGHSVGGHFIGFAENHAKIKAHAFVCVGSGYWGDHALSYRPLELFFWHIYGPAMIKMHGFMKAGSAWTGTSLPRGVFETWKRWCHKRDYFRDELATTLKPHFFEEVTAPIGSWIYTDDPIANPRTGAAMLECYPKAPSEMFVRKPSEYGLKQIAHNGPFAKCKEPACEEIWQWLEGRV